MIGRFQPQAARPLSFTELAKRTWYTPERIANQAQYPSSMLLPGSFPAPTGIAKMVIGANGQHMIVMAKTFGQPVF